jgi:hypothetical protein
MSEGFSNPVSNAIGTLVRKALQSFGFVAGVFGWQIQRNGNAEFNNVTIRGQVIEGVTGGLRVEVGPGAVIKFYNAANVLVGQLDATGYVVGNDLSNLVTAALAGTFVAGPPGLTFTGPSLQLQPGASFSGNWKPGFVETRLVNTGFAFEQQSLVLSSPAGHLGYAPAPGIELKGAAQDGTLPGQINYTADTHVYYNHDGTVSFGQMNSTGILSTQPSTLDTPEAWHSVAGGVGFGANWADVGLPTQTARYRLMPDGTVMLSGGVKTTAAVTGATIIFTLPAAYRPLNDEQFPSNAPAGARIAIQASSGRVILLDYAGSVTIPTVALSHIRFAQSTLV